MELEKIITGMITISKEVGSFIRKEAGAFNADVVELKRQRDLVSYVDKTAEQKLVKALGELLPEAGFITEENQVDQKKETYTWIVDPLDGTTNFVHGIPTYAVSVALMLEDQLAAGVVYEIARDECFSAVKNHGAMMNGSRISVSATDRVEDSLFATGLPIHNFTKIDEYLGVLNELMRNSHGLRRIGSAATDLAYVACGRFEAFYEYNLNAWDVAAGALIVQEAGGHVSDFKGGDDFLFGREIVAGGKVHPHLLNTIRKFW